jgi:hypothetical protein
MEKPTALKRFKLLQRKHPVFKHQHCGKTNRIKDVKLICIPRQSAALASHHELSIHASVKQQAIHAKKMCHSYEMDCSYAVLTKYKALFHKNHYPTDGKPR